MKDTIYVGETIEETIPGSTTLTIGNGTTKLTTLKNISTQSVVETISTENWKPGNYAAVWNISGVIGVTLIHVVDPLQKADELQYLITMISEIDNVIQDRATNAVTQVTINNRTIIHESIDVLLRLRSTFVERANKLRKQQKRTSGLFKSVTVFR